VKKATHVTFRQPRWRKILPANPGDGKSTTLTHGVRDFSPTGMAEGYFPPHGMAERHVSLSPLSARLILTITFEEDYF
jgi:hypothetical protein